MARRRPPMTTRMRVMLTLLGFTVVTTAILWRRSTGVSTARAMRQQEDDKRALNSQRLTLERDIRDAQSRRHVVAEAERRLGLHVATEAQTRILVADPKRAP